MKKVCLIALISFGILLVIKSILSSAQICLESAPGDSKSFGFSLAVSEYFLAVGDPEANRVVIYTRKANGGWLRTREILPPDGSAVDQIGSGFGYSLALDEKTLFIGSYKERSHRYQNKNQFKGEVYYTLLGSGNINSIKKVEILQSEMTVGHALSIFDSKNNKIAIGGITKIESGEWIGHILVADMITGQVQRLIEAPNPEDIPGGFGANIDSYNGLLLIGANSASPLGGAYFVTLAEGIKRIPLDETRLSPGSVLGSSVALADGLMAIGRSGSFGASDTLVLKQLTKGWSLVDVVNLSGSLDATKSHVLISAGPMYGMPSPTNRPDHLLVRVDEHQAVIESEIRWKQGNYFPIEAKGLIDSNHLLLSQQGKVVHLPIANLPRSYLIKKSHCKE